MRCQVNGESFTNIKFLWKVNFPTLMSKLAKVKFSVSKTSRLGLIWLKFSDKVLLSEIILELMSVNETSRARTSNFRLENWMGRKKTMNFQAFLILQLLLCVVIFLSSTRNHRVVNLVLFCQVLRFLIPIVKKNTPLLFHECCRPFQSQFYIKLSKNITSGFHVLNIY